MQYVAFLGTGECDPNKLRTEVLAIIGLLLMWLIVIFIIKKINKLQKSSVIMGAISGIVLALALVITIGSIFGLLIGNMCN